MSSSRLERWTSIALINLGIVAILGFVMRSKLIFSMPFIDFKHTLHAHSHFAFGGWITLALLALMIYQLLPKEQSSRPVYKWLLTGILANAAGMLISFLYQGYGPVSIGFSTTFIFTTYGFAYVFIKDLRQGAQNQATKVLAISAVVYLVLSSIGPFTLAYLLANRSSNLFLYKDSVYTYLHLQYNGFFTLTVFALMFSKLKMDSKHTSRFAAALNLSVIPSMFLSYLWHYPGVSIKLVAAIGCATLIVTLITFFVMMRATWNSYAQINSFSRKLGTLAMLAFALKVFFQSLTIIPSLGPLVFANRPVIIGFLHLVLLGFVTLYLLAYFIQVNLIVIDRKTSFSIWLFVTGIMLNESILMLQGLGVMFMMSSAITSWMLWTAAICLMLGATLLAIFNMQNLRYISPDQPMDRPISQS